MIHVGWLQDDPGYVGGAELTAGDLRAAAPDEVKITYCPPGHVEPGLDLYVVHNCMFYRPADLPRNAKAIRFVHDERGPGPIDATHRLFYSPLQRDFLQLDGELCPAPLARDRFHANGNDRDGAVHIGTFGHHGKGQNRLCEWAQSRNEMLVVYGHGPFLPSGPGIEYRGALEPYQIPEVLQHAARFVHLPTTIEGYGRGVAEAWACGCELHVNHNVGCLWWLQNDPDALDTAVHRFWEFALNV